MTETDIADAAVTVTVNGRARRASVPPRLTLADFLRERCQLTGTHLGCEHGVCGACTVLLDGEAVRSCLVFAVQADGAEVTTVEGIAAVSPGGDRSPGGAGELSPVQEALRDNHGLQCGFCTPGFVVSVTAFLRDNPDPTDDDIREALSGNLCRCTGYQGILKAVRAAADAIAATFPHHPGLHPRNEVTPMAGRLEGKVAFISGAGRGQGRSHAIRLAAEGADIIAVDILEDVPGGLPMATADDLAETVKAVEALDRRIIAAKADVRDVDALKTAVDDGVAQLGRLDFIVANAGIASMGGNVDTIDLDNWKHTIDINLSGVFNTARAGVPHIVNGGRGGSIVLTSSVGGMKALPGMSHYVSAKHGVVGLMRALAVELGPQNIRVNSVHPTNVKTPMFFNEGTFKMFRPDVENPGPDDVLPIAQMMHTLPIGWVEAEDISNAVLFLLSDESRFITGVPLPVDGGSLLK